METCGTCTHFGCSCKEINGEKSINDCHNYEPKLCNAIKEINKTVETPIRDAMIGNNLVKELITQYGENLTVIETEAGHYVQVGNNENTSKPKDDKVNHPSHYTTGAIECIYCIEASMTPEGFQDYCKGNVIKYIFRWREKGGIEDLRKASVYLNWMIESAEKGAIK